MIDVIFFILVLMALINGFRYGFIRAIFSVLGLMVGLAAAMKLSLVVAGYLQDATTLSGRWLPVLSFLLVFIGILLLVRIGAALVQKAAEAVMLGWLNRIAGIFLYLLIYIVVFSVVLFYADKIHFLSEDAMASSRTYPYIKPCGPAAVNVIGYVIPFFRNMFHELEVFFMKIGH